MPLLYIFPSEPDEIAVLHRRWPATHRMLPRTFFSARSIFPKESRTLPLRNGKLAESLNPNIPSLQASMGRVLLNVKKQPAEAAAEFQRGCRWNPAMQRSTLALIEPCSKTGKSPAERAEMMQRFPDLQICGIPRASAGQRPP